MYPEIMMFVFIFAYEFPGQVTPKSPKEKAQLLITKVLRDANTCRHLQHVKR